MKKLDLVSEVFSTLRLKSRIYFKTDLAGEFSVEVPRDGRLVRFHLALEGSCWVSAGAGNGPVLLPPGGLAVIPHGRAQVLASSPELKPVPLGEVLSDNHADEAGILRLGKGPGRVRLLCGFCGFDEQVGHPILDHLPRLIVLQPGDLKEEPWIVSALNLMALETDLAGQGMKGVLSRLLEIAFIQIVRREKTWADEKPGYMRALGDEYVSKALLAVHQAPEIKWTVARLAGISGMSRARFAERFTSLVGLAPMAYVTNWRLIKAAELLRRTNLGSEEVAARCGYASLPSFSRRFKAVFGMGPGAFRKRG